MNKWMYSLIAAFLLLVRLTANAYAADPAIVCASNDE